jgi:hypothetical protein
MYVSYLVLSHIHKPLTLFLCQRFKEYTGQLLDLNNNSLRPKWFTIGDAGSKSKQEIVDTILPYLDFTHFISHRVVQLHRANLIQVAKEHLKNKYPVEVDEKQIVPQRTIPIASEQLSSTRKVLDVRKLATFPKRKMTYYAIWFQLSGIKLSEGSPYIMYRGFKVGKREAKNVYRIHRPIYEVLMNYKKKRKSRYLS